MSAEGGCLEAEKRWVAFELKGTGLGGEWMGVVISQAWGSWVEAMCFIKRRKSELARCHSRLFLPYAWPGRPRMLHGAYLRASMSDNQCVAKQTTLASDMLSVPIFF